MKVLVACEESQEVCKAFRVKGHEAYSCDIVECSGDVTGILNGMCVASLQTGETIDIPFKWDLIIAHPPCTDLAVSGARHFEKKRKDGRQIKSIEFFCKFLKADCKKICIENPIGIISGAYTKKWFPGIAQQYGLPIKPTQIIQPYEFGHKARKATCLWLKGLKNLEKTSVVEVGKIDKHGFSDFMNPKDKSGRFLSWKSDEIKRERSKTFPGIAKAMADQWG